MKVSVIIPTFNRADSLQMLLISLADQTYPCEDLEVIVADDGSTDETPNVVNEKFPYDLRYCRQPNRGAATARNLGAKHSTGELLIFLDDDISVEPSFVSGLVQEHAAYDRIIAMGTFRPYLVEQGTPFQAIYARLTTNPNTYATEEFVPFTELTSNSFSIKHRDFFAVGMMQDPTDGALWPNWDDIDFAYRAYRQGFRFRKSSSAICYHRDHALNDLATYCRRLERAAEAAVLLFQKFPHLQSYLPMFRDKGPISWETDGPGLSTRKILRIVPSWEPIVRFLEQVAQRLEVWFPSPFLLMPLYRWIAGGYIWKGYRRGLESSGLQVSTACDTQFR